jgi:hypothetical protein
MYRLMHIFSSLSAGASCKLPTHSMFLLFPTWYEYLPGVGVSTDPTGNGASTVCNPQFTSISDLWLIVAAAIEILLRIAAIAAVGVIIYGGILYTTSQGNPEQTAKAKSTLIAAFVGLGIAVFAAGIVTFIAGSIS